jgi:hypothetical protein
MPTHEIEMQQTVRVVGNADVSFVVHADGDKLGELRVSRGTIDWWPRNSKSRHTSLTWERFAKVMEDAS